LGRNYDIPALLGASEQLNGRKVRIFVAGDGDLKPEVEAAASRGQLTYLGRLSFEQLAAIYPSFDIALACYAPGSTVSMPFKAFDYLAAGLPLVTSLAGDLGMFVQTHRIGAKYTPGDSASLAEAVIGLACDPKRRELAGNAAKRLGAEMDYPIQYSIAANLIEEISAKRPIGNRL
jgi:glycosyltransferase involved in cell wall biosynthesis